MPKPSDLAVLLTAATSSGRGDYLGSGDVGKAMNKLRDLAPDMAAELIRLREVLRRWDDDLPGCLGGSRCECGYAEARALLEVPDAK